MCRPNTLAYSRITSSNGALLTVWRATKYMPRSGRSVTRTFLLANSFLMAAQDLSRRNKARGQYSGSVFAFCTQTAH